MNLEPAYKFRVTFMRQHNVVCTVTTLRYGRPRNRVSIPSRNKRFLIAESEQTGSGVHPASWPVGTAGVFTGFERPQQESDHSHASSGEANNAWICTSTPSYAFMACTGTSLHVHLWDNRYETTIRNVCGYIRKISGVGNLYYAVSSHSNTLERGCQTWGPLTRLIAVTGCGPDKCRRIF